MKKLLLSLLLLLPVYCANESINENEVTLVFRGVSGLVGGKVEGIGADWDLIKEIVEREMPEITLKLNPIFAPEGEYFTKLAIALRNDYSYDIISEDSFILQSDVAAGLLDPLPVEGWDDWTNFYESSRNAATINGKVYTIPWNTDARGIFYSKKLFAQAGLPKDWRPNNWNDILSAARKIKNLNLPDEILVIKASLSKVYGEGTTMQTFLMILYGTEDPLYENGKWVVDSKGLYDTLEFLQTLRQEDLVLGNEYLLTTTEGPYSLPMILTGDNAIRFDGSWTSGSFMSVGMTNWRDIYGFTYFPTQYGDPNRPTITFQGGFGYSISANSRRKEKAWEVIKLITSHDALKEIYPVSGHLSTRKDVAQDENYQRLGLNKEATELASYGFYRPANNEYPAVSTEIQVLVENIMLNMDIKEAITVFGNNIEAIVGKDRVTRKVY
ncbi:MAG: extracellular solute-binding protein [Brevinema sp.]